jgi:propionyl-CoA carboxylase alpha chain
MPSGPGVRVDTAVEAGDRVPPDYDPLIAKLLVVDDSRNAAIDRLTRALDEVEVTGIQTTLPFHRFVARHEGFRAGDVSTSWVDEEWEPRAAADRHAALAVAAQAAAAVAAGEVRPAGAAGRGASAKATPGRGTPSWRLAGRADAIDRWPR